MYISSESVVESWEDYTLIVPAVCVGNVGQLSVDLLIHTLWMEKVGCFYTDAILPVVGNDPFAVDESKKNCKLVTSCEVYMCGSQKLVAIQQRAPFVKGKRKAFQEELVSWIEKHKFKDIVILTSSFAQDRTDRQISGTQFRFLLSAEAERTHGDLLRSTLEWVELEKRQPFPITTEFSDRSVEQIHIPGGGIAKSLFEELSRKDLSAAVLLMFCSEGDNTFEGVQLATYLNTWQDWIDLKKTQESVSVHKGGWRVPSSWKLTYGNRFEQTLFQ